MPIATLEEMRLLSNLETRQNKLLQIVLFGQPELDQRIARPEIRQLKERITYSFHLSPFRTADIREYLNARLRACGYRRGELFTPGAVRAIGWHSRGLVRRINILADKALLAAYADNSGSVAARHVRLAAQDSEFIGSRRMLWLGVGAIAAGLALLALVLWTWQQRSAVAPEAAPAAAVGEPAPAAAEAIPETPTAADDRAIAEPAADVTGAAPAAPPEASPAVESVSDIDNVSVAPPGEAAAGAPAAMPSAAPEGATPPVAYVELTADSLSGQSEAESELLRRQLASLPPEDLDPGGPSSPEDACRLCWSLVYRPLYEPENL
jgi:hypothetical protein